MAALADLITGIRIDTAYGPPIVISDPFKPSSTPNPWLARLKPQITLDLGYGLRPIVSAPWGAPGQTAWPEIKTAALIAGAAVAVLTIFGVVSIFRSRR